MSSRVAAGAAPPRLSCTCGPVGTASSGGGAPRLGLTIPPSSALPSGIHCTSEGPPPRPPLPPMTPLTRAPSTFRLLPVAVSPIHSSMPLAAVGVGRRVPFGLVALGNLAQRRVAGEGGLVRAVGLGIEAPPGEPQHGLR